MLRTRSEYSIPDPGSKRFRIHSKELKYFSILTQKTVSKHFICDFFSHPGSGSRGQKSPGSQIRNTVKKYRILRLFATNEAQMATEATYGTVSCRSKKQETWSQPLGKRWMTEWPGMGEDVRINEVQKLSQLLYKQLSRSYLLCLKTRCRGSKSKSIYA